MKKIILKVLLILIFFGLGTLCLNLLNGKVMGAEKKYEVIEEGIYRIKTYKNNKVLDVTGASKNDTANIEIWENNNTNNQKFYIRPLGSGYYTITSINSNKVLDVAWASKEKGANIQQYHQTWNDNQSFMLKKTSDGYYNIISKCNGLYLDVTGNVYNSGTNIELWENNNGNNQKFKLEIISKKETPKKTIQDGIYSIKSSVNDNFALDIEQASGKDCANVELWQYNADMNQKFEVKALSDNYYSIKAVGSGKMLDVEGAKTEVGANIEQYKSNNQDNQKWIIKDAGNGYYNIISKCNGLYVDIFNGEVKNGTNIIAWISNGGKNQKFKFEKALIGNQTISDGLYKIQSSGNKNFTMDVTGASKYDGANIEIWSDNGGKNQKFDVKYIGAGHYKIISALSDKALTVNGNSKKEGANVEQSNYTGSSKQKWIIQKSGNGTYRLISEFDNLYVDVSGGQYKNGTNIAMWYLNANQANQKFIFTKTNIGIDIDSSKYPHYAEKINQLASKHPNWNIKLVYTGLTFDEVVDGEYAYRGTNLVPSSYQGEWIDSTKTYDTGSWYGASRKAIAYYIDPRNFLDENNIFQFLDVNSYDGNSCNFDGIKRKVNGTYLNDYANDINQACANTGVNPYYVIARLLQEQGNKGGSTWRMNDNGKYYYNPFNIGATGNGRDAVIQNALTYAKNHGWDTMEKAVEAGISFLKANWLDNYQNTLYTNKFDIDIRSGNGQKSGLYAHQYMGNLMAAYSEALILRSSYKDTGKLDSNFTFYIPVYESMNSTISPMPSSNSESKITNVRTTGTKVNMRSDATTDSSVITMIENEGTVLLSIERGINQNWQKVCTTDGKIGYIRGDLLEQIDDVKTCNYSARIKTNDGDGCYGRYAPTKSVPAIYPCFSEGTTMTVIDNSTYKNIDGYDWYRVILSNGTQAFFPGKYIAAN